MTRTSMLFLVLSLLVLENFAHIFGTIDSSSIIIPSQSQNRDSASRLTKIKYIHTLLSLISQNHSSTMKYIIHQNNQTLAFLRAQDFASAVKSASLALKCHRLKCPKDDSTHPVFDDCLDQCMLLSNPSASDTETSPVFIYMHGIMLDPSVIDTTAMTAILIFNCALSQHLLAVQQRQYHLLHKARRLYQLAYNAYDMDKNILFQFAVINNSLSIDRHIGHDARERMEHLISLFMIFVDQGCDMHLRHIPKGFLNNLSSDGATAVAA